MIGSNDKRKIAVFANDAGGANLILFFIKRKKIKNPSFFLKGPALKIFKKNIKKFQNKNISNFNKSYDLILTGTSWSSDFEKKALIKAKKLKINSITMLDHYINYRKTDHILSYDNNLSNDKNMIQYRRDNNLLYFRFQEDVRVSISYMRIS